MKTIFTLLSRGTEQLQISYEIHLSEEINFEPTDDTLFTTIVDKTEYELTDLTLNTIHYLLIIAVDGQGNRSLEREYYVFDTQIPSQISGFSSKPDNSKVVNFYNSFVDQPGVAQFIKVGEIGNIPLTVDSFEIFGEHASDFQIISPEFPFTIEEGAKSQTIKVQCFASDFGLRTANLQLSTNDLLLPKVSYALECNGVSVYTLPIFTDNSSDILPDIPSNTQQDNLLPNSTVRTTLLIP